MMSPSLSLAGRLLAILAVCALAACRSAPECNPPNAPHLKAEDRGLLQIPDGMPQPDRTAMLAIPPPSPAAQAAAKNVCLDRVPSYFGTAGRLAAPPEEMIADWAQAWADRNGETVVAMYSQEFIDSPAGGSAWSAQRRDEVASGPEAKARLENVKIAAAGTDRQVATFVQRFGDAAVKKELTLKRENGVWKIESERVITAK